MKVINLVTEDEKGYNIPIGYLAMIQTAVEQFKGLVVGLNRLDGPVPGNLAIAGIRLEIVTLTVRFNNGEMTLLFVDYGTLVHCVYYQFKHKSTGLFSTITRVNPEFEKYPILNCVTQQMAEDWINLGSQSLFQ